MDRPPQFHLTRPQPKRNLPVVAVRHPTPYLQNPEFVLAPAALMGDPVVGPLRGSERLWITC